MALARSTPARMKYAVRHRRVIKVIRRLAHERTIQKVYIHTYKYMSRISIEKYLWMLELRSLTKIYLSSQIDSTFACGVDNIGQNYNPYIVCSEYKTGITHYVGIVVTHLVSREVSTLFLTMETFTQLPLFSKAFFIHKQMYLPLFT